MRRTILLADDSVTIRKIVELTFGETDIRVESVASGREALERLRELRPDLVLADVVMPGPSGYEVCRAVKEADPRIPVLLLAGTFEPFDAEMARACGSDGHITKPFDSRLLIDRVEHLLARGDAEAAPAAPDDELEAVFEDLASPPAPGMIDAPERTGATPISLRRDVEDPAFARAPEDEPASAPDSARPEGVGLSESPAVHLSLTPADIDAIAQAVVERLSDRVLREIAWEVVPDLAEVIVRERIRDLERDGPESS